MVALAREESASGEFRTGWRLLLVAMLGCGLGVSSLPLYTAGVFIPALQSEFGWTRAQLSSAVLIFTLSLAAASPIVGRLVDRMGVPRAAGISIICAATCYWLLSTFLSGIAGFYAAHIAIAALGAAAAPVAYTRIITAHFTKSRGLALGIALLGPSLAATVAPALIASVIDRAGWQGGYLMLAGLMLVMLPFLLLLKGPSGITPVSSNYVPNVMLFTDRERRRIFMTLMSGVALFSLGIGGLVVHLVPMLVDSGAKPVDAAQIAGLIGLSGMAGRLIGGALADRFFAPYILVVVALMASAGCAMLATLGVSAAAPAAISIGFALGAEADLMGYLVSRYFPKSSYSRVFGWQYAAFISCVGLSPLILGYSYDRFGNYDVALFACTALLIAAAGVFICLPKFRDTSATLQVGAVRT